MTAGLLTGLLAVPLMGGCATRSPSPPVTTVTVYPDETTVVGQTPPGPSGPSSVPTVTAPGASTATTPANPTTPTTPTTPPQPLPPVRVGPLRGAPADFAQAQARVSKASPADAAAKAVQSPSGNIYCTAVAGGANLACEVAKGRASAPATTPCPGGGGAQDVGRVELGPAGAQPVCNSDTIRTDGAPRLAYGKRWAAPGTAFTCLSESTGVTCIDAKNQHGFFIAQRTYATF